MTDPPVPYRQVKPSISSTKVLALAEVRSPIIAQGIDYWERLREARRFPARAALSPRAMAAFLKNVAIIDVLDGGEDYRYRLVGDAHTEARGTDFSGATLSEIEEHTPRFAARTRALFDTIRRSGEPCVVRGAMDPSTSNWRYNYRECAFLPLGQSDDDVDGLLAIGIYALSAPAQ